MSIIKYFFSKNYRVKYKTEFYNKVDNEERQKDSIFREIFGDK